MAVSKTVGTGSNPVTPAKYGNMVYCVSTAASNPARVSSILTIPAIMETIEIELKRESLIYQAKKLSFRWIVEEIVDLSCGNFEKDSKKLKKILQKKFGKKRKRDSWRIRRLK